VINGAIDYKRYLAALASDGLNYTRIFGGTYVEVPAHSFGFIATTWRLARAVHCAVGA